jgi:beta-lactamase class A
MRACTTGTARLRAGLPADWRAGDKTGTGTRGAANDVAIVWPPRRAPWIVAVYLSGSQRKPAELNEAHRRIAQAVVASFTPAPGR